MNYTESKTYIKVKSGAEVHFINGVECGNTNWFNMQAMDMFKVVEPKMASPLAYKNVPAHAKFGLTKFYPIESLDTYLRNVKNLIGQKTVKKSDSLKKRVAEIEKRLSEIEDTITKPRLFGRG